MISKGLLLSLITVFLWAIYDVCVRFIIISWQVDPLVFVSLTNLFGALTLLVIAGPGRLSAETLKSYHTWSFSSLYLIRDILYIFILGLISATEANFLLRSTIILSLLISWGAFNRKPSKHDLIGSLAICFGIFVISLDLPENIRILALFLVGLMSIVHTLVTFISEIHPTSNKANTIKDRCRVTGYVLLVTSLIFITVLYLGSSAKEASSASGMPMLNWLPDSKDFVQRHMVLSATLIGITLVAVSNYFYFYATRIAKSEVFLIVTALLPIFTFVLEFLAGSFNLLNVSSITSQDMIAGSIIVGAAMYMIYMRRKNEN